MDWDSFTALLAETEELDALLVNLLAGKEDGGISDGLLSLFAEEVRRELVTISASGPIDAVNIKSILAKVAFGRLMGPEGGEVSLLYACPIVIAKPEYFVSFLTWQKLWGLVPKGSPLCDAIEGIVDPAYLATSDSRPHSASEMRAVAEKVNELGPASGNFRVSFQSLSGNPFSFWMTSSNDFAELADGNGGFSATRTRDWLGLGHFKNNMPIFAFRSKHMLPDDGVPSNAARPTVFDGITNGYFKYKRSSPCTRSWGRALDLAAAKGFAADCDGGPEIIVPGPVFGEHFVCEYIGHIDESPLPTIPYVVNALLGQPKSYRDEMASIRRRLVDILEAGSC